ncbi:MAG: ABC transporter permease [Candidatus Eremiobacteraeota bacterium]|nr:ABC transporter permease [Candidatus Eremiobacteraeota bacterium]
MNSLALVRAHARVGFLDLIRWPGYVVPTVVFPAMFYVLFDLPFARRSVPIADATALAFIVFAIAGVTFYQFGVGIAQERGRPWERYIRTLPAPASVRFAARIGVALAFGIMTASLVALTARAFTPIDLSISQWLRVFVYCLAGGVPFVLIGISLGYWVSARAAVPIATALNLLLAYAGGLWMPPSDLPRFVAAISPYLPTREFAELLWSVAGSGETLRPLFGLAAYAALFGIAATVGYRRDERKRYA